MLAINAPHTALHTHHPLFNSLSVFLPNVSFDNPAFYRCLLLFTGCMGKGEVTWFYDLRLGDTRV